PSKELRRFKGTNYEVVIACAGEGGMELDLSKYGNKSNKDALRQKKILINKLKRATVKKVPSWIRNNGKFKEISTPLSVKSVDTELGRYPGLEDGWDFSLQANGFSTYNFDDEFGTSTWDEYQETVDEEW
ncbi:MAG: hypothetical protein GY800_06175, partial [Planctomycetes bacterium]|nr:hypothetical protein [Planctomycetota bacterium]